MSSSIIDEPGRAPDADALSTASYAQALASFIVDCDTPITVGIQGEWGSGKTTLLGMMQEHIENQIADARGRGEGLRGADAYRIIWVNTWEHSILATPETCLISILSEITDRIIACDGSAEIDQKVRRFLGTLARGALIGGGGMLGGELAGNAISRALEPQVNPVRRLRETLESTIKTIIHNKRIRKFVIFIDDLDRLEPTNAVRVLELLKNIFAIENCVFVLAIDYQVIVKGLKGKFGELTEHNEWEFRAFFDKIIQVPFMMPVGAYTIDRYLQKLLVDTNLFKPAELARLPWLATVIKLTIGHNPRALKRMINSLSLINIHRRIQETNRRADEKHASTPETAYPKGWTEADEWKLKAVMLTLVCIQISYPKLYEMLVTAPDFTDWDEDLAARLTKGTHLDDEALPTTLARAMEINEEDFDEDWKQTLFKVIWTLKGNSARLVEMSRVMSQLKDNVVAASEDQADRLAAAMIWGVKQTSMTSVVSTDDQMTIPAETEEMIERQARYIGFWHAMRQALSQSQSAFRDRIRPGTVGMSVSRSLPGADHIRLDISCRVGTFIRVGAVGVDAPSLTPLFEYLKTRAAEIEQGSGCRIARFDQLWFKLECPREEGLPRRGDISEAADAERQQYCRAVARTLEGLEPVLQRLIQQSREPEPDTSF